MASQLNEDIKKLIKGEVTADQAAIEEHSRDASLFEITPALVVYPQNAEDISQLVDYLNAHPGQKLSLTVRSGGTDMSGGPLSESIIVNMKHLDKISDVGDLEATAQPGAYYRDFETQTLAKNLLMPSYPASRDLCTIGGIVANNSGGEKTLAYGKTEDYIKQLKVILRDGKEYTIKPLSKDELDQKMAQSDLEGEIYSRLFQLIDDNYDLLQQAKPKVSKNSAGYYLWNVYDKQHQVFDLTKLITGSQGTLGIITEVTFKLITPHPKSQMLVIFLKDLNKLADVVNKVLAYQPESFESYDDHTMKIALRFLPDLIKQLKAKNLISLGFKFLPEFGMVLTGGLPKLILIAEFTGQDQDEVHKRALAAETALQTLDVNTRLTKSSAEAEKYWVVRRESFSLLRHHVHHKRTAPFIDDICVTPSQLPEFLPKLTAIMKHYDLTYTVAGHIGDANFHIIPLMDTSRPDMGKIIDELSNQVYDLVHEYHGTITAEHNDGLVRTPFLPKMYPPEVIKLFKQTKQIFDPDNIFNPCKKVESDWKYNIKHLIKEQP